MPSVMKLAVFAAAALALAGCAIVKTEVAYDDGAGKKVTASYFSTKDVAAPTFSLARDDRGNPLINVGAESSLASPVIAGQAAFAQGLAQGITAGLIRGMKSSATGGLPLGAP